MNSTNTFGYINIKDFTLRYKLIRKYRDFLLGDTALYKDKIQSKTVIVKEKILHTQEQFDQEFKACEMLLKLNNTSAFTKLYSYTYKVNPNNSESPCVFHEIREYPENDLEKEVSVRLKNQEFFTEEELWKLTNRMITALAKLQYHNTYHANIRPKNILMTKEGDFKIHWSNFHMSLYDQLLNQSLPLDYKCVLSPEVLDSLFKQNPKPDYNTLFSDVFSLGLTLLYAATLGDIEDLYDWNQMLIIPQRLNFKLSWFKATYSERLYKVLEKMVQFEPVKRSDFQSLLENIHAATQKGGSQGFYQSQIEVESPVEMFRTNSVPKIMHLQGHDNNIPPPPSSHAISTHRKVKQTFESETVFEPKTTKGGSPRSPIVMMTSKGSPRSPMGGMSQIKDSTSPFAIKLANLNQGGKLNQHHQRTESRFQDSIKEEIPGERERTPSPILTRRFSPLKKENQRNNATVLKELQEQILYDEKTGRPKESIVMKHYNDGSNYQGEFIGKMRNGYGIYYYKNGDIYAGGWRNDKFHGRGVYLFPNGERYEGDLVDGVKQGKGVYYYLNKNKYLGEWKNGRKHGKGAFHFFSSGETYDGEWCEGERHGVGTFHFATGDKFTGTWMKGEKQGHGVIFYSNGSKFEGNWRNNRPNGKGTMIYTNGDKYEGNWLNGVKSGYGVYYYPDGSRYEGEWVNDDKEGAGIFYYAKGDQFTGTWKDGLRNGMGAYEYHDGGSYEGEWVDDLKSGKGVLTLADGTKYDGRWDSGERHGDGVLMLPNGDLYVGEFKKDMISGRGKYTWANGDVYEGEWMKNMMHGQGVLKNKNGEEYRGVWEYQKPVKELLVKVVAGAGGEKL